jgi:xylono-1,5-lactonase
MTRWRIIERGDVRDTLGEGLLWSPREQALYWTDILTPALNRLSLGDGNIARWPMPERIGWVIERRNAPGLIAGFQSGFAELDLTTMRVTPIVDPEPDLPDNRLNDAKADRAGNIWAGTMPLGADRPTGNLYRLGADRRLTTVDRGYSVANGPAFSPDEAWLYHTDTVAGTIYRFPFADGQVTGAREAFIRFEADWGKPDGMCVDAEGGLWVAHWGGARVTRFTPEGRVDHAIALPASQITNVCFAGPELDRMFVTSAADGKPDEDHAGALFEIADPGVRGLAPNLYAG